MDEPAHSKFMQRCLDLAVKAEGMTYPNPMVGAVIVCEGKIIGEGYHIRAGKPHAEVHAVNSVKDKSLLRKSTIYVSLEPCSHFGKTPPCTDLITDSGIPEAVIGTKDTSEKISGRGIEKLESSGCKVITGILEDECRWINRRFFTLHEKKRPYVILKWAQSEDGFLDTVRDPQKPIGPNWISGKAERVLVHRWRATEQAILAGGETVRKDNPGLDVRYWTGKNPLKLILSRSGNVGDYLSSVKGDNRVILFTENDVPVPDSVLKVFLEKRLPASRQILEYLYREGIQSLFIEGGGMVLSHFIDSRLWDEARIITGSAKFGNGVKAPAIKGDRELIYSFDTTTLHMVYNGGKMNLSA